jgi:hypothetical protein
VLFSGRVRGGGRVVSPNTDTHFPYSHSGLSGLARFSGYFSINRWAHGEGAKMRHKTVVQVSECLALLSELFCCEAQP